MSPVRFTILAVMLAATPAMAQLGGLGGGLGNRLPALGGLPDTLNHAAGRLDKDLQGLAQTARDLVGRPLTATRQLDRDDRGFAIIRSQVLAVSPSDGSLAIARALHFTVLRQDRLEALGLTATTLQAPDGMDTVTALATLRRADASGDYDFAHIYNPSGDTSASATSNSPNAMQSDARIGMIDGGVEKRHAALSSASVITQGFAGKPDAPGSAHGTAIASLLVGRDGDFSGYLPGATLYAGDVFGGAPDGGSAAQIARALNWMAQNNIAVTNISLAGPPNALLAAAVKAFVGSGHLLVAAVGNDGPAAPPNYPAAYPGVIAVTSVDAGGRIQLDASRGGRFAARGVDVRAASLPRGYANVTGTSYAAPAITARFARILEKPDPASARTAADRLAQISQKLDGDVWLAPH
jgi:hypothetical protein